MFYKGKYFDLFESALSMQMLNSDLDPIKNPDIISLRCCSFVFNESNMYNCIEPRVPLETAIKRINQYAFDSGGLELTKLEDPAESKIEEGDILGPVLPKRIFNDTRAECYSGQTKYLFCSEKKENIYKWHCAYEYPYIIKPLEEVAEKNNTYIINLSSNVSLKKQYDKKSVLTDSLHYIEKYGFLEGIVISHPLKRKEKISIQIGLYNYILQIRKYVDFFLMETGKRTETYDTYLLNLCTSIDSFRLSEFNIQNRLLSKTLLEDAP